MLRTLHLRVWPQFSPTYFKDGLWVEYSGTTFPFLLTASPALISVTLVKREQDTKENKQRKSNLISLQDMYNQISSNIEKLLTLSVSDRIHRDNYTKSTTNWPDWILTSDILQQYIREKPLPPNDEKLKMFKWEMLTNEDVKRFTNALNSTNERPNRSAMVNWHLAVGTGTDLAESKWFWHWLLNIQNL